MKHDTLTIDGQELHFYYREGSGSPLLFFHATGFHSRVWDAVIDLIPERPVYAIDAPGHGRTPRPGKKFRWDRAAESMLALVRELGLSQITGIGHSMGGQLVLSAASLDPARFSRLLLLDPVVIPLQALHAMQQVERMSAIARRRNRWESVEEFVENYKDREPYASWAPAVFRAFAEHGLKPVEGGVGLACDPDLEASVYRNFGAEKLHERLERIDVPVHIIRARARSPEDKAFTFKTSPTWPELANKLPYATEDHRPDLEHFFPMEMPEFIAEEIRKLLG